MPLVGMKFSLYGFTSDNCSGKDFSSEKIVNTLLPISYLIHAEEHAKEVSMLCGEKLVPFKERMTGDVTYKTEVSCSSAAFVNPPPNDVCITYGDKSMRYFEAKIVLYKERKTELILRQDCYAYNCLHHIIENNRGKAHLDINSITDDPDINETPYLAMLLWKKQEGTIVFDCVILTDVSVLRRISRANTERSRQAILLINKSLCDYFTMGKMTYKEKKGSTVPHQKVSLFPFRDSEPIRESILSFTVKATELLASDVRPDTNLWQEVEKSRMKETIRQLENDVKRLQDSGSGEMRLP